MGIINPQTIALTGLSPSFGPASAGGDQFKNDGTMYVHVKNGSAASINVIVNSQVPCNQGYDHDATVAVPAAAERLLGPFPCGRFNDATGYAQITYSAAATVTVAIIKPL